MLGFDYNSFREAVKRIEQEKFAELEVEVNRVKEFIEKSLTSILDSTANTTRMNYPGVEL